MNTSNDADFEKECEAIRQERETYQVERNQVAGVKILDWLSTAFLFAGFVALALTPFTGITLLEATCLFIIHYTIAPTDLDYARKPFKGMAVDLAHIRANLSVMRKGVEK